ncbi:MAG TPA: hypothetical protein VN960_00685 [Gaiellaceae bacterium]|nr:hypothetical protein [Gaiellaceae bacterium]
MRELMPTFRKTPRRRKSMVCERLGRHLAVWEDLRDDCAIWTPAR